MRVLFCAGSHLSRDVSRKEYMKLWISSYSALLDRQQIHVSASVHDAL